MDAHESGSGGGAWCFPPFSVDGIGHQLTKLGVDIPLDRACVEILAYLLGHAGEVVTKEELLEAAWPNRVVGENSLNKAIGRIRVALQDEGQQLIRTVHGYGYRLAGSVTRVEKTTATSPAENAEVPSESPAPGDLLEGRAGWRLLECLGSGSFSEVWAASNADGSEQRAIKFASGQAGIRALKREVALYKLMRTATGDLAPTVTLLGWNFAVTPCYVEMPVLANGNLRQWGSHDGRLAAMSVSQRLELAIRLVEAVAQIHELGIIHKDLKPENILIEIDAHGDPKPLLTDFGAGWVGNYGPAHPAYPLSTEFVDALREYPQVASALYAAPEIVRRETPTACADVYALGVLLYQIVTGDLQRPLSPGWEDDVADPLLRSDIAGAAALDPAKRIQSAHALAQSLRLIDRRRDEAIMRTELERVVSDARQREKKTRARRRTLAVVAAVLIIGMGSTSAMYWYAERARQAAQTEARRAKAMLDFMTNDVIAQGDPYGSGEKDISLRQAVDNGSTRIDEKFADDPETALSMHHSLCTVYSGMGEYALAIEQCSKADQLASNPTRQLTADSSNNRIMILSELALAQINADRLPAAEQSLDRMGALLAPADTSSRLRLREWAITAQLRYEQSRCSEARALADRVSENAAPDDRTLDSVRANALWYGALCKNELIDYAGSRKDYQALISLREATVGPEHVLTAWAYCNFAGLLTDMGQLPEAEAMLTKAAAIFEKTIGRDHPDATTVHFWQAKLYIMQERWSEAIALLKPIIAIRRDKLGETHSWTTHATVRLADAYLGMSRLDDAQVALDRVRPPLVQTPTTAQSAFRAMFLSTESELLFRRGRLDEALQNSVESMTLMAAIHLDIHPLYAQAGCQRGRILRALNRRQEAQLEFDACEELLAAILPPDHPLRVRARRYSSNEGQK